MSSLGTTILRPQRFGNRYPTGGLRMADLLVELSSRLALDAVLDKSAEQKIQAGIKAALDDLKQTLEQRQRTAARKVNDFFKPLLDAAKGGVSVGENSDSAAGVVTAVAALLNMLCQTLQNATAEDLAAKMNELCDIVENDLGLNESTLTNLLRQTIDHVVEELTAGYLAGDDSPASKNNFIIGSRISALKFFVLQELEQINLEFDRQQLITDFTEEIKKRNWNPIVQKISEITCNLGTAMDGVSALFSLDVDVSVSASVSTPKEAALPNFRSRAASRDVANPVQYSWYANWALSSRWKPWDYFSVKDRLKLAEEDLPQKLVFGDDLSDSFMEHWAHVTDGLTDAAEAILHGASIERGDHASNITNLVFKGIKAIFTWAAAGHEGEGWMKVFKATENVYFENILMLAASLLGSLENKPKSGAAWAHGRMMPSMVESYLYSMWANTVRDFTLSLFTLVNADKDAHPDAVNNEKDEGFILFIVEAGLIGLSFLPRTTGRKHYGIPFNNDNGDITKMMLFWMLGGVVGSQLLALASWGVAGAISGKNSEKTWELLWLKVLLRSLFHYQFYYYLFWEGDTDDGHFGLDNTGGQVVMPGYADHTTSPYLLPFEKDKTHLCVQGHHGIWSHNPKTYQIYGVDFPHDFDEEVLAMRGGTVIGFEDSHANNDKENWNFIVIRHDDPLEGVTPNSDHDKDQTGVVRTYAVYGHGRQNGITDAFATRGIVAADIIGTVVRQGQVVMHAGDTGRSGYNHLHVHVTTAAGLNLDGSGNLTSQSYPYVTIPFVFKDALNRTGKDGVPKALNFYTSENEKVDERPNFDQFPPPAHCGRVVFSTIDSVELESGASSANDFYKNAHVFIRHEPTPGNPIYYFKKITGYDGSTKIVTIEGNWGISPAPPVGSAYVIGAPAYADATTFWKTFAYFADHDGGGNAVDFPDGKPPFEYKA
ncbi:MAG: M23 family metallopeptidase [Saprospiraceae bacterium]